MNILAKTTSSAWKTTSTETKKISKKSVPKKGALFFKGFVLNYFLLASLCVLFLIQPVFANVDFGVRNSVVGASFVGDESIRIAGEEFGGGGTISVEFRYNFNEVLQGHTSAGFEILKYSYEEKVRKVVQISDNLFFFNLRMPLFFRCRTVGNFFTELGGEFIFSLFAISSLANNDVKKMDETENFNVSVFVGTGYEFPFGLDFDIRFNYGLLDYFKNTKAKQHRLEIGFGYWFK